MCGDAGFSGGVSGAVLAAMKLIVVLPLSVVYILDSCIKALVPRRFKRRNVKGETVLITGGSSGLGRELAVRFGKLGAYVIIWGRNKENLQQTRQLVEAAGGSCTVHVVDVTDREAIYRTAEQVHREFKKVDILVNNAGVVYVKNLLDTDDHEIQNTFNVNVISHFYTAKAFLPAMIRSNSGHIVTVASLGGYQAVNKMTDYCATKFGAVGFSEALTMELRVNGATGVHTTLVCPYYFDTGMFSGIKSNLMPVMTPDGVADNVTDAILMQQRYCIPWFGSLSIFLASFLPEKLQYLIVRVLGLTHGLDEFSGRHKHQ